MIATETRVTASERLVLIARLRLGRRGGIMALWGGRIVWAIRWWVAVLSIRWRIGVHPICLISYGDQPVQRDLPRLTLKLLGNGPCATTMTVR